MLLHARRFAIASHNVIGIGYRRTRCQRLISSTRQCQSIQSSAKDETPTIKHEQPMRSPYSISRAWRFVRIVLALGLFEHIFGEYFYEYQATWGISMLPTLAASGDAVVVSKYYRRGRGVQVGHLVSFKHPMNPEVRALKRVLALPGDFVLRDSPGKGRAMMIQIPEGHCYVVGDNLDHSRDSRMFGPLPLALITGRALYGVSFSEGIRKFDQGLQEVQDELIEDGA